MRLSSWTVVVALAVVGWHGACAQLRGDDNSLSLTPPFSNANWRSFGSAVFSPTQAVLTSDAPNSRVGVPNAQRGMLWNQLPVTMSPNWEVIFRFKITGQKMEGSAEGMALWLTTTKNELGSIFGSRDYFKGLAIVFDSKDNDKLRNNPSISAHYFNGQKAYNLLDDGLSTQLAGCIADYRRDNIISAKISYNSTHLSVFVDLTGSNDYRKCLAEKVDLQLDNVFLGCSAETTNEVIQEKHEVVEIAVKGVVDSAWQQQAYQAPASGYKPPAQQQYQPPAAAYQQPPAAQQQVQPPPPQQQYQAPPTVDQQNKAVVGAQFSDEEAVAVHEKLDHLLKAAASSLDSQSAGEALKEIEQNLRSHVSAATKAILMRVAKLETLQGPTGVKGSIAELASQLDVLNKLMTENKGSVDAGRVEAERRFNELDAKLTALTKDLSSIREVVERSSRSTLNMMSQSMRNSSQSMNKAAGSGMGWWLYVAMFQTMFVVFLLFKHMSGTKRYDKLI